VSRDCFFVRDPVSETVYLWIGRGATEYEGTAKNLAPTIFRGRDVRLVVRRGMIECNGG